MSRLRVALMSVGLIAPIAIAAAPVVAHAATCAAQSPGDYPNDPDFAAAENNPSSGQTWDGEDWYLYGCIPQSAALFSDPRVLAAVASQPKSPAGGPFLHHVCAGRGSANSAGYAPTDITPEDLIVAFGHCQITSHEIGIQGCPAGARFDNDGNGYPDD